MIANQITIGSTVTRMFSGDHVQFTVVEIKANGLRNDAVIVSADGLRLQWPLMMLVAA